MKTLTLFRHAKSGWDSPVSRDFDRPLNDRGVRGAKLMGQHARSLDLGFDHVVSSPAVRCTETLDGFWEGYGRILHPNWDRRIYLASGAVLMDVIHDIPEEDERVLLCGHNPGLEDVALSLLPDDGNAMRDSLERKLPTAAIVEIEFDVERWAQITDQSGRIVRFVRPRDLDPSLGPQAEER